MKASVAFVFLVLLLHASVFATDSSIGRSIENFSLSDHLGFKHSLDEWGSSKAVVVVFLGTDCPLAKLYATRLVELAELYKDRRVQIVGVNANSQDSLLEIGHFARSHKIDFPLLKDVGNKIADQFGAKRTPEAFLLDERRVVRYQGRVDDQYGIGYSRPNFSRQDLAIAIDELLSGKQISEPLIEAVGCHIGRAIHREPTGEITYSNQISRLLQKHCVRCHRPAQIAPFSLLDYDEVSGWADTICEVMSDGRMPPWHANPQHGEFMNDARMTDEEKETFTTTIGMDMGIHEYKFVINGENWTFDPENTDRTGPYNNTVVRVRK